PRLYRTTPGTTCNGCTEQLVGASNGGVPGSFIEIKVPWSLIGNQPTPAQILRFTVSTYYNNHVIPNDGHPTSALIDAASTKSTTAVLDDGAINAYFDLHFDANGEVFSPLLISEFLPNPIQSDDSTPDHTEWIEIYNPNNFSVSLDGYKIGDAARKTGGIGEAMRQFPNGKTIGPNGVAIVARLKTKIVGVTGSPQLFNYTELSAYSVWATGASIGLDNNRDQIVLLDNQDTIVDLVEYTFQGSTQSPFVNSVPITFPPTGVPESDIISYERCPAAHDTNNSDLDFFTHDGTFGDPPTPGVPCPPATGVDLNIQKTASPPEVLAGSTVNFNISWFNNGDGTFTSVVVTDTLPANVTFVSQSSNPTALFTPSPGAGQPMQWNFTALPTSNVSGTIILTATVAPTAPSNTPLVNTAGVRSGDPLRPEAQAKIDDGSNFASASVTAIKPDLKVVSTWPSGALQNTDFTYVITATNHGVGDASGVVVTDTLPTNSPTNFLTFVAPFPPQTSVNGQQLTWNVGSLPAGQSSAITVKVHLGAAPTNTILTNNIIITGTPPDDSTALADNSESKPLVAGVIPDLSVVTNGWPTSKVAPGAQFCYSIFYAYGPNGAPATNIVIKDALPQGLTLISQTAPGLIFNNATSGDLIWTKASLSAGQSGTIQVCVKVNLNATSDLTVQNVVSITGLHDSSLGGNNVDTKPLTFDKHKVYVPVVFK
ncbi:MAG TPA: lamin tail domain-containing protein, partial [Roseiflexaceae bacterium]